MANFENNVDIHIDHDVFTDSEVFEIPKISFGISSFPPNSETDINPDYGEIKFFKRYWTETDAGATEV